MWLYYGRSIWHGHAGPLSLGVHAHGMDMSPDLGYPEVTGLDPERLNWTRGTVSHNTVVVDARSQATQWVAIPRLISETDRVKLVEVDAPLLYPQITQLSGAPVDRYAVTAVKVTLAGGRLRHRLADRQLPARRHRQRPQRDLRDQRRPRGRPRRYLIAIGQQTLTRGLLDPADSNGGYTYDITVGATCAIPLTHEADAARGEPVT